MSESIEKLEDYGLAKDTKPKTLFSLVGIVGAGSVGQNIARMVSSKGLDVIFLDLSQEKIDQASEEKDNDKIRALQTQRQSIVDENATKDVVQRMSDYLVDKNGTWLISDYGLDKMEAIALQLLKNNLSPEEKLLLADQMLNVVHQRSDLAGWFVDGGRRTLDNLSE